MKIELRPLHPSFGAEVVGIDLARDLDEETIATIIRDARDASARPARVGAA
jgi:hypothetical protein